MSIDSPHPPLTLRAIGFADVRSGILPSRSSTAGAQAADQIGRIAG